MSGKDDYTIRLPNSNGLYQRCEFGFVSWQVPRHHRSYKYSLVKIGVLVDPPLTTAAQEASRISGGSAVK